MALPSDVMTQTPDETLESVIAKTRELTARARPPHRAALATLESRNSRLADALQRLAGRPSVEDHLIVADEYRKAGVLDQAYEHYAAARARDSACAAAHDGLARIWRDWKLPGFGLGDAYRAVHYAPRSPEAWNTLGTILQALGSPVEARLMFTKALSLDVTAPYALNNLCYAAALSAGRPADVTCPKVIAIQSDPAAQTSPGYAAGVDSLVRGEFERAAGLFDSVFATIEKHDTPAAPPQ